MTIHERYNVWVIGGAGRKNPRSDLSSAWRVEMKFSSGHLHSGFQDALLLHYWNESMLFS